MHDIKSNHELPSFKWIVLAVLLVTVLSVTLKSPLKTLPEARDTSHDVAATERSHLENDPYDLRPERGYTSPRNRVETGL